MKCHYQVLGVAKNASDDDIKRAYRKLALKWHPDKNLENQDEAKEQFQLVQQAWEILSDPRERTWYDNHREAILKGGIEEDYEDRSINLFPYFSASCFKGYGDNEKGFYTVYRNLFEKLAAEDAEFQDSDTEIPGFGDSQSSYMEVVHNFYSYWYSYSTKKSYAWLDPYNVRNMPGHSRRIFKLAEKENKKVRDKAKRERNEQVRNLVAFVRKRDKRVQTHAEQLAARAKENLRKTKERRKAQLLERRKLLNNHTESEWSKFSNIEAELEKIEANLAEEFGEDDNKRDNKVYYCMHCDKLFKTHRTFANHEKSEKHVEMVSAFNAIMADYNENCDSLQESNSNTESDTPKEPKLATDSQMPDFLLNPSTRPQSDDPRPHSINKDSEDDSLAELISDDEENPRHPRLASEKKKTADVPLATGPEMEGAFGFSPKVENEIEDITSEDELISDQEEEIAQARQKKKKKKKRNVQNPNPLLDLASDEDTESINEELWLSKKQRKKLQQRKATITKQSRNNEEKQEAESEREGTEEANIAAGERPKADKVKKRSKRKEREERRKEKDSASDEDLSHRCVSCSSEFPSKNKLFEHLKKTGHSVYIPELSKCKKNPERKERTTAKGKDGSDKKKR